MKELKKERWVHDLKLVEKLCVETSSCNLGRERNNTVHIFSCIARMITYYKKILCY